MIKVKVYSTAGQNGQVFDVEGGLNFGQLKARIGSGYPWATSSVFSSTAENGEQEVRGDNTVMPTTDFCLYVYPTQTKSGTVSENLPYNAAKRKVVELSKASEEGRRFFSGYEAGSTEAMNKRLVEWKVMQEKKAAEAAANDNVIEIEDVITFMKNHYSINSSTRSCTVSAITEAAKKFFGPVDLCQAKYDSLKNRIGL